MQYQSNQITQGNMNDQPILYQPLNSDQSFPISSEQTDLNPPPAQYYQKPQMDQYFLKPNEQIQSQNNNIINDQQINLNNQFFLVPELQSSKYIKGNKFIIPFNHGIIYFYIFLFISSSVIVIFSPSYHKIIVGILFAFELLLFLYFGDNKIKIIKDDFQKKIHVNLINYLFFPRKRYDFDLENINFKVILNDGKYVLIMINNYKTYNMVDIYNNPINILYYFKNINVKEFNGNIALNNLLDNFMGLSGSQENPLNFDIYSYMHKTQDYYNNYNEISNSIKYLKINEHFYTYFNKNPLLNKKFHGLLLKIISGISHSNFLMIIPTFKWERDKSFIFILYNIIFSIYFGFYFYGFFICLCIKCRSKYNCKRIDIIYSSDYEKLLICISKNNDLSKYIARSEFFLNDIDRFILQKKKINDNGFYLLAINKRSNISNEICFIEDIQTELEGLAYILNERLINSQQQYFTEFPPTPTPN